MSTRALIIDLLRLATDLSTNLSRPLERERRARQTFYDVDFYIDNVATSQCRDHVMNSFMTLTDQYARPVVSLQRYVVFKQACTVN